MIIASTIIFILLLTLAFLGLQDCYAPIKRYVDDRFEEKVKPAPLMPVEVSNDNLEFDGQYQFA